MKKIIVLTLVAMIMAVFAGCGLTRNYAEPTNGYEDWGYETWTEELDLSLVERYEFDIWSDDFSVNNRIVVENAEDIATLNDFLGNNVILNRSNEMCDCAHNVAVNIFLKTGEGMWFGITGTQDGYLVFDNNGASWIIFDGINYDDFMDLVMSLGNA